MSVSATVRSRSPLTTTWPPPRTSRATIARRSMSAGDSCSRSTARRAGDRFGLAVFPAVVSRAYLARTLAERGLFDEGDAHGQQAIRIAETLDHPFSLVVACLDLAYLKRVRGELSQAAHLVERAVAQCREWNITTHTPIAMAALGHVYAWSGRMAGGPLLPAAGAHRL